MPFRKTLTAAGLAMVAFAFVGSATAQIRTPENSYPATPEEMAATADLNRHAQQGHWRDSQPGDRDWYRHQMHAYHREMQAYHQAEHRYWQQMRAMQDADRAWRTAPPQPVSRRAMREHDIDAGIVGQQIELLEGDFVGKVVGVDRDAAREIRGVFVRLEWGKVVWIDVADVRYDSPYGVIYTDLDRAALHHMPDERA